MQTVWVALAEDLGRDGACILGVYASVDAAVAYVNRDAAHHAALYDE